MPRAPAVAGWRALLALQVLVVGWLAFDPHPPTGGLDVWDKAQHAAAFAVMAFTATLALPGRTAAPACSLLVYGLLIEVVQAYVPGRSSDWRDVIGDAVGIAIGLAAARVLRLRR